MDVVYVPSERIEFQGSREVVYKKYGGKGWRIEPLGGGNGNWLVYKLADVLINGKSYRSFVLDLYGKDRLSENLFEKFCTELKSGKITLPA